MLKENKIMDQENDYIEYEKIIRKIAQKTASIVIGFMIIENNMRPLRRIEYGNTDSFRYQKKREQLLVDIS